MDKIILEKAIHFSCNVDKLYDVSLKDSIDYKLLDDGCSVVGVIKLSGIASTSKGNEKFDENIDVDIYAPFSQVIDQAKFSLKVDSYETQILRDVVVFKISLKVNGFRKLEELDNTSETNLNNPYNLTNEIDEIIDDPAPLYDNDLLQEFNNLETNLPSVNEEIKQDLNSENKIEKIVEVTSNETRNETKPWATDLFKQKDSYVTFYKIHRKETDNE